MRSGRPAFYSHISAVGLGGELTQPVQRPINTCAQVALSGAGGFASAEAGEFHLERLISFSHSHVRASSRAADDEKEYSTLVTAVVEQLNILDVVTAARIVAQVSIAYPMQANRPRRISLSGSQFTDLRILGRPIEPVLHDSFLSGSRTLADYGRVGNAQGEAFSARPRRSSADDWSWARERYGWMRARDGQRGVGICSLVDSIPSPFRGASLGHVLQIPDFGSIFLGEILLSPDSVQLSMIRAELGCNTHGAVTAGFAGSGGTMMPPGR